MTMMDRNSSQGLWMAFEEKKERKTKKKGAPAHEAGSSIDLSILRDIGVRVIR